VCDRDTKGVPSIFKVMYEQCHEEESTRIPVLADDFSPSNKRRREFKVYFQQNKKRRKPKVKIVTLQLCEVRKNRYNLYENLPTCAA
jgi:hypothetical protein